jgi:hypothetical protein
MSDEKKQENKELKMFGAKTTDEAIKLFNDLYEMERGDNPELTKGKFFEMIVESKSKPQVSAAVVVDDTEALKQLEYLQALNDSYGSFIDDVCTVLGMDASADNDAVVAEIRRTQQRAMMALETQVVADDTIELKKVPVLHRTLLAEVCKRLSVIAGREVTASDVLLDMFIRYNVEQFNEWFYPFVVKPSELEDITGYSALKVKLWLKQQKQKADE